MQSLDSQFAPSRHNKSHSCASYGTSMRAMVTSKFHSLSKNSLSDARTVVKSKPKLTYQAQRSVVLISVSPETGWRSYQKLVAKRKKKLRTKATQHAKNGEQPSC